VDAKNAVTVAHAQRRADTSSKISALYGKSFIPKSPHQLHPGFCDPEEVHAEMRWFV